jgi:hypothetical protein
MSCELLSSFGGKFQLVRDFGRNFSSNPRQIFTLSATREVKTLIIPLKFFQLVCEPTPADTKRLHKQIAIVDLIALQFV